MRFLVTKEGKTSVRPFILMTLLTFVMVAAVSSIPVVLFIDPIPRQFSPPPNRPPEALDAPDVLIEEDPIEEGLIVRVEHGEGG